MKVAYITDDIYLEHNTGAGHPESAHRLTAIEKAVKPILGRMICVEPISASKEILMLVHTPEHIYNISDRSEYGGSIDADTVCSSRSYDAACKAAGSGVAALDGIKNGRFDSAFCAVRPPGHHATPVQAMGFCLFNNIAIAAKYAQTIGYDKVMIIDFDVHHGNGTQDTFYSDDTVFYLSSHQAFAYPGTGMESQKGEGAGRGYTANYPVMPDSGDAELLDIYTDNLPVHVEFFKPDILLVSAGYDLHESDPLAQLNVTTKGIGKIVQLILQSIDVPSVFFLEGGYDVNALGRNVLVTLEEMISHCPTVK